MFTKKSKKFTFIVIVLLALGVTGVVSAIPTQKLPRNPDDIYHDGKFTSEEFKRFMNPVKPETPSPVPPPARPISDEEMITWKTYINQDMGYSIKYPPDWHYDPRGNEVAFGKIGQQYCGEGDCISFAVYFEVYPADTVRGKTISNYIAEIKPWSERIESTTIDGIKATKIFPSLDSYSGHEIIIPATKGTYWLNLQRFHPLSHEEIFQAMGRSFRLLDR